jgi:hypothetical protein
MARTGKGADNIFARTAPAKDSATAKSSSRVLSGAKSRGRPVAHDEPTTKATVVLFNRQIATIDRLTTDIRARTGNVVDRAAIIRALLDAVNDAKLELGGASSADDVRRLVAARFKGGAGRA